MLSLLSVVFQNIMNHLTVAIAVRCLRGAREKPLGNVHIHR